MNLKFRLNIKSIIKTEMMLGKPFSAIDYTDEQEIRTLLYCILFVNNPDERMSIKEFDIIMQNPSISQKIYQCYKKECELISGCITETHPQKNEEKQNELYIKDLIPHLAASAVINIYYLLYEMELSELPLYIKAAEQIKREKMEEDRLWTFLSILPHIDAKKIKSPSEFYTFPWEKETKIEEVKKNIEQNEKFLIDFLTNGENILNRGEK